MITPDDLAEALPGLWAVHPTRLTVTGRERYRRRPISHLAFGPSTWQRFETSTRRRFRSCGTSQGGWQVTVLEGTALLVLTVTAFRPSTAAKAALESNLSYSGGALVVMAAGTARARNDRRMRDGEARMYFLPLEFEPGHVVMAPPSDGRDAPRQSWFHLGEGTGTHVAAVE